MLLSEPQRTPYDLNFPLFGIPIRVSPWFWAIAVVFGAQSGSDGPSVMIWTAALFLSILVHELGHALTMQAFGFRPWIVLYAAGGLASYDPRDGYRSKRDDTLTQILICAAGPIAGFLLAAILVLGLYLAGHRDDVAFVAPWGLRPMVWLSNARLATFFNDVFYVCVFWGLVNLLPVYPLDGGQIAREILLRVSPGDGIRHSMMLSICAAAGMALYGYVQLHSTFVAIFFAYLAYMSFVAFQNYSGRGGWQ